MINITVSAFVCPTKRATARLLLKADRSRLLSTLDRLNEDKHISIADWSVETQDVYDAVKAIESSIDKIDAYEVSFAGQEAILINQINQLGMVARYIDSLSEEFSFPELIAD